MRGLAGARRRCSIVVPARAGKSRRGSCSPPSSSFPLAATGRIGSSTSTASEVGRGGRQAPTVASTRGPPGAQIVPWRSVACVSSGGWWSRSAPRARKPSRATRGRLRTRIAPSRPTPRRTSDKRSVRLARAGLRLRGSVFRGGDRELPVRRRPCVSRGAGLRHDASGFPAAVRLRDAPIAVLALCDARRIALSPDQHAAVVVEGDVARLTRWLTAAATAGSGDEIFAA